MTLFPPVAAAIIGFIFCLGALASILRLVNRSSARSRQEFHHTHHAPVPRFGGLGLALTLVACEVVFTVFFPDVLLITKERYVVIGGAVAMFVLGFADDLRPLGAKRKLLGQLAVATSVACMGVGITMVKLPFTDTVIHLQGWGVLLTVLWLVAMTNLINLVDGIDGLAGGISLMLMVLLLYISFTTQGFMLLTAAMAGGILAFLRYNFPPARIYLGDGGAYLLGFLIGALSLVGSAKGAVFGALAAPLLVLALPIVDTCVAIVRRGAVGLPVFRPDQRHIHHRLLGLGLSRRRVVVSIYAVTLVFLVLGMMAVTARGQLLPVLVGSVGAILLFCAQQFSFSRRWMAVRTNLEESLAMRNEVQYALHLAQWLKLEAQRSSSMDECFEHMTFAAQRLGFVGVTVRTGATERSWSADGLVTGGEVNSLSFRIRGGQGGELELTAPSCVSGIGIPGCQGALRNGCPCVANPRLMQTVSDLMAESWSHMAAVHAQPRPHHEPKPAKHRRFPTGRQGARPATEKLGVEG